jgi:pimeloyl-ACP methyl ester carboxylesterase
VVQAAAAVLLAVALGASACSSPPVPPAFDACPASMDAARTHIPADRAGALQFGCITVRVPVSYDDASGEQLSLTVTRVRHRDRVDPLGALVLLSGGPGQSGLELASTAATLLPVGLLTRFDLVAYDPRGVGESAAINCGTEPDDPALDSALDLRTPQGLAVTTAANRRYAALCLRRLGARAGVFSTTAAVRDLDAVHQALGDERLTAIGYSYGAKVGAQYAHRFPDRVRALVLDAPSDPRTDLVTTARHQVRGFEAAFDQYAAACASRPTCARLGDPRRFVADLVARAFASPVASRRPQDSEPATGHDVLGAVVASLYDDARWPDLDDGLYEARYGDAGTLFALAESVRGEPVTDPNAPDPQDANFVINCTDAAPGPSDAEVLASATAMVAESPLFGPSMAQQLVGCREWAVPRVVLELPTATTTRAPVVVVGTVHDPATPYAGAVSMTEVLGHATLLTYEGEGHTAVGRSSCVDRHVEQYLTGLQVPPEGARCPP